MGNMTEKDKDKNEEYEKGENVYKKEKREDSKEEQAAYMN